MKLRLSRTIVVAWVLVWMIGMFPVAAQDQPVKIGVIMSLSGELASFGQPLQQVAALSASHVNEQGGVLGGRPLELLFVDDRSDPEVGASEAARLVSEEGVSALITMSSGVTLQVAAEVSVPNQIVHISLGSSSRISDLDDDGYVYRVVASDEQQGAALADLADRIGYTRVAILYADNEYGSDLAHHFTQSFARIGGQVAASVPFEEGRASYREELEALTGVGAEALVLISYPESGVTVVRDALEHGYFDKFLFSDGLESPAFVNPFGNALDGTFGTAPSSYGRPGTREIKRQHEERYGEIEFAPLFYEMYDAVFLLALAIEKAGETTGSALREAMRQVNVSAADREGLYAGEWAKAVQMIHDGTPFQYYGNPFFIGFDDNGDPRLGMIAVWTVIDGKIREIAGQTVGPDSAQ